MTNLSQHRWLTSITLSKRPDKSLYQCDCNCVDDCPICLTPLTDSDFLRNTQFSKGLCRCSFGDCVCVTFHARLNMPFDAEPGFLMALCQTTAITLGEESIDCAPGHTVTGVNSMINCPDCIRKRQQYHFVNGGWEFPRVPVITGATLGELSVWQEWATEFLDQIEDRRRQLSSTAQTG